MVHCSHSDLGKAQSIEPTRRREFEYEDETMMGTIASKERCPLKRGFHHIEASTSRFSIATMRTSTLLDGTNPVVRDACNRCSYSSSYSVFDSRSQLGLDIPRKRFAMSTKFSSRFA